jgi:Protein of unknown function (DUF3054)
MASQEDAEEDSALSSSSALLSTPLDRPLLAIVDAMALLVFAGIGKASHGTNGADGGSGVAGALQTVGTALPFLVAWFATSPLTGVYKVKERTSEQGNLVRDTIVQTAPGWALAIPLGCVLRGVIRGYAPPLAFVVVAMVATLLLLSAGRIAFSVVEDFFVELV